MPNTTFKKEHLRDFVSYHKWVYVLITVCVWMLTDVLYSATEYKPPEERQVYFQIVTPTVRLEERLPQLEAEALAAGQEFDPTLEEVVFQRINYDPENDLDGYGGEQYMLMLGVAAGDIYMVTEDMLHVLVNEGYVLPLEGYIEQGILNPGDVDLASVTFRESPELDNYDPDAQHVYAIPTVNMNAMLYPDINVDNREMYMALMAFSGNPDTSAFVMNYVINALTEELPEWITPLLPPEEATDDQNAFDSALQGAGYATPAPTQLPEE